MIKLKNTVTSHSNEDTARIERNMVNEKIDTLFQINCKRTTNKPIVVLVESNGELRSYLTHCLSDNYDIKSFGEGAEALSFIKKEFADLVICNMELPGMGGEELSSRIKTNYDTMIIPVILFGSSIIDSDQLNKREASLADIFICLPFNIESLKVEMAILIKNHYLLRTALLARLLGEKFLETESPMIEGYTYDEFIKKVRDIVWQYLADEKNVTVDKIAKTMNMCRTKFTALWESFIGEPPSFFIHRIRMERAMQLLKTGNHRVGDIPVMIGMKDYKNFRDKFKEYFGMTPQQAIALGKRKLVQL